MTFLLGIFFTGILTIPSLKKEISKVQIHLDNLNQSESKPIANLYKELERISDEKLNDKGTIAMLDEKIIRRNNQLNILNKKIKTYDRNLYELSSQISYLKEKIESQENSIVGKGRETKQLRDSLSKVVNQFENERKRSIKLRKDMESIIQQNEILTNELIEAIQELETIKKSIKKNNTKVYAKYKKSLLSDKLIKVLIDEDNNDDILPSRIQSLIFDIEFFIDDLNSLDRIDLELVISNNNEKVIEFEDRFFYENYVVYHSTNLISIRKEIEVSLKSQKLYEKNRYNYFVRIKGVNEDIISGEIKFK